MTLTIRVADQNVTRLVTNVQTKNSISGGFESVTFGLKRDTDKSRFVEFSDCLVYDAATAEQVGGGRLLAPTPDTDGTWKIQCQGEGISSMTDRMTPYMLVDHSLEQWNFMDGSTIRHTAGPGNQPGSSESGLLFRVEPGLFGLNTFARMLYRGLTLTGQSLGGFNYGHIEGLTNTDLKVTARASDGVSLTVARIDNWNSGPVPVYAPAYVGTHFTGLMDRIELFIQRTAVAFTADDNTWSFVANNMVMAQRYDKTRTLITGSVYSNGYVTIDQAFTDWVARYCPRLDLANARIDAGTHQFDQVTYFDGVTGMDLMGDMTAIEGGFTWQVWEKGANGWRTELKAFSTTVRYEASVDDGFNAPSPSTEIYNKITVTGKDPDGSDRVYRQTQSVPSLDAAGIVRETSTSMGTALWSDDNAAATASEFLDAHKVAPNAGTLTIARPIYDGFTGRWVKPWNIRSGDLIRVRGVQPTPDTLNATSPDGVTVFRIVSVTYDDDSGAATLELDSQKLTLQRAIANNANWITNDPRLPKLERLKVTTVGGR